MRIAAVGRALPPNYYDQSTLIAAFEELWGARFHNPARLRQLHEHVLVGGRHLALPMDAYPSLGGFAAANDAFIRVGRELGAAAVEDAVGRAGLTVDDIDHLFFVSVTGIATPSLDALLCNRLGLRADLKRTPIFGLGCVAGAAGVARAADYLRGFPEQVAVLLSVELCSLTLQRQDLSIPNLIGSGLFGDGAAAALLVGAARAQPGPRVVATRSVFYRDTEHLMGWRIEDGGFGLVLSPEVPAIVARHLRADVDAFLAEHELRRADLACYVCHPGGPKILEAMEQALEVPRAALAVTWDSLRRIGNLSSASVLMILRDTLAEHAPEPGAYGLMLAMGPGFCSELVLLQW